MTNDDLLYRHRLLVFARAAEVGVSRACEALGYHRSWFYRWKGRVEREGLEVLRPRERRPPRMPNQIPPWQGGIDDDVFQLSDRPAQLAGVA